MVGVTVSFAVMAHRKREQFVEQLSARLEVTHDVVWDMRNDRWDTGRRSLMAYDREASHHVVLQDDAVLPVGFAQACANIAAVLPDNPVCFYFGAGRRYKTQMPTLYANAKTQRAQFIARQGPHWGVAVMLPTKHIRSVATFGTQRTDVANYDLKIARWYLRNKTLCYYTVPSLVDHRDESKYGPNPSLVEGRSGVGRVAIEFAGEHGDVSSIVWDPSRVIVDRQSTRYYW